MSSDEVGEESGTATATSNQDQDTTESEALINNNSHAPSTKTTAAATTASTDAAAAAKLVEIVEEPSINNNASNATTVETLDAIAERLSFFFSDANIRQDAFIRKFLLKNEKVPIEALLRFNTIKKLTTNAKDIVTAAKKLCANKVQLSQDETAIGPFEPFTLSKMDDNIPLSLYIGDIPKSKEEYLVNVCEIKALFQSDLALCKLRFGGDDTNDKQRRRVPVGAAIVEFKTLDGWEKEAAETLTIRDGEKIEPKRELKLGDTVLSVMALKEYVDSRKKRKKPDTGDETKEEISNKEEKEVTEESAPKVFTHEWKPGCVIRIKGVADTCDREALLEAVSKGLDMTVEQVKEQNIYVDYSRGQPDGAIRFKEADSVQALCDKLSSGDVKISGAKVESATVLEGEDEKEYWEKFIEFKNKQLQNRFNERSSSKFSRNKKRRR